MHLSPAGEKRPPPGSHYKDRITGVVPSPPPPSDVRHSSRSVGSGLISRHGKTALFFFSLSRFGKGDPPALLVGYRLKRTFYPFFQCSGATSALPILLLLSAGKLIGITTAPSYSPAIAAIFCLSPPSVAAEVNGAPFFSFPLLRSRG